MWRTETGTGRTFLGLECGGTKSVAILATENLSLLGRVEAGPANLRLLTDPELVAVFRSVATQLPAPAALGIGMAGVREESDRRRVRAAAAAVWPGVPCFAGNDLETALAAAEEGPLQGGVTRVILISGTGSCCYGRNPAGQTAKVGGWGHWLGDRGSGYDLGLGGLRTVVAHWDATGRWPALGQRLLRALQLNEPNEIVDWVHQASKADVAQLALEVFAAWERRDHLASLVVTQAAQRLAADGAACARRLTRPGRKVEFVLTGSVLLKQARFAALVARQLRRAWAAAAVRPLTREGAWGAVTLAKGHFLGPAGVQPVTAAAIQLVASTPCGAKPEAFPLPAATAVSPTEQRHPRSMDLDRRSARSIVELMLEEEAVVAPALLAERRRIARAVGWIAGSFREGGRLFYVGAGTSGRLGVLDASECPPTFRTPPDQVQGILAGGAPALWSSIEGAEDDAAAGARAVQFRGVSARDVVVGIAASGGTPYVWGALQAARELGARTILLCFNPHLRWARPGAPDLVIAPNVGPEILTGSTRLKAGTATKLVLNILTTAALVRQGKAVSNLMVDLNPSNTKLRGRAVRIVRDLTEVDEATAQAALERVDWVVKTAVRALRRRQPK